MQFLHLQGCLCLFLHTSSSIKRTMQMIYLELSLAFLLLILLLILPLFLLPFILFLLLLTYPASSLRSSSKGECLTKKKEVYFPPSENSYSLYVSKILTSALTQYPRKKRCVCQVSSSLRMFFRDRKCWNWGRFFFFLGFFQHSLPKDATLRAKKV